MKEEVIVTTHPGEVNRFIYPRFYELYDKKGHLLASSSTIWVVIDMNSRRVLTKPFGDRIFKSEVCKDDIPLPEKIRHGELEKIEERKIRNSDIDLNGHLNNSRYIDFIIDTFEQGFFDDKVVSDILVNYEKELKEGDYVELFVDKKENIVEGKHDGKECFTAQLEFRNI